MLKLIKYFLALVVICFSSPIIANNYSAITYSISPKLINNDNFIKVEAKIDGQLSNRIVINFPYKWADAKYAKQIKNIRINYPKEKIRIENLNGTRAIITLPKSCKQVSLSYEIHQLKDFINVQNSIILKDLIHGIGYGIFAVPKDLGKNKDVRFAIRWKNLPSRWKTISSYGTAKMIYFTGDEMNLLQAFYAAGNLRIYPTLDHNNQIYLSLYGNFDSQDSALITDLIGSIKSQRSFFKDYNYPYYAISLIEGDNPDSAGGTGLHNSFVMFFPKKLDRLIYYTMFAHEHFHNWVGHKIHSDDREEGLNYWWSEGFTEYYSRVLALRSNGISIDEFIKGCNQFLRDYYLSSVINESNIRIKKDFWNNPQVEKLPYYRGFVFALYLNYLIKQNNPSNSLDNVMLDHFKNVQNKVFSISEFKNIIKTYLPQGIDKEFFEFIEQGETISLKNVMKMLPLEKVVIGNFDVGFINKDKIITTIDKNSNAYKAGLRDGYKIIEVDFSKDKDPKQIVVIKTDHGVFEFMPENQYNKKGVYQLKTSLSAKDKIKKFFGASE